MTGLSSVFVIGVVVPVSGEGRVTHVVAGGSSLRRGDARLRVGGGGVEEGVQEGVVVVGVEGAGGAFGAVVCRVYSCKQQGTMLVMSTVDVQQYQINICKYYSGAYLEHVSHLNC